MNLDLAAELEHNLDQFLSVSYQKVGLRKSKILRQSIKKSIQSGYFAKNPGRKRRLQRPIVAMVGMVLDDKPRCMAQTGFPSICA